MSLFSNENALNLYFLIAPALYLVNTIIAITFIFKYKGDSIYKKNAAVWFFYLIVGVSQGALQLEHVNIFIKTAIWSFGVFLLIESMSLFAADIFKIKNKIKTDSILYLCSFCLTSLLFYTTDNFFLSAMPVVFFAAYPVLRLIPLLRFFKNNSFTKNGYLLFSIVIALHVLDYAYAANKPEYLFPGYLVALMLMMGASCFIYAVLIERAIMEVEIKDLLHNTSRLAALGGMAAEIAHEIKNPLTVLALNNYQLKQKLEVGRIDESYLKSKIVVYDNMTKRLISIMDALKINYQSGDRDDYNAVFINKIFEETRVLCDVRAANFGVKLTFEEDFKDLEIVCRSVQITQVLQNLIHNAIDVLENSQKKWIKVEAHLKNEAEIEIFVSDSGPGIPQEIRHKIFDTLFTTKSNGKGTGLGLSISKRFIEQHGGYLKLDQGSINTKFIIGLPINQGTQVINKNLEKKAS